MHLIQKVVSNAKIVIDIILWSLMSVMLKPIVFIFAYTTEFVESLLFFYCGKTIKIIGCKDEDEENNEEI